MNVYMFSCICMCFQMCFLFEGVSVTTVILAPGACGRGAPNSSFRVKNTWKVEEVGKFPEACFCRQAAYFSDFTSHESVPEAWFCRQAACFSDFLKKGSPGVSKELPGHHFQLQLYQQTPDPPPSAAVTCIWCNNVQSERIYIYIYTYIILSYIIYKILYKIWHGRSVRHAGLAGRPDFVFEGPLDR